MKQPPTARDLSVVLAGLSALFVFAADVLAGQFSVRPLGLTLSAEQSIQSFTVTNPDDQPVTVQMETLEWSQDDGASALGPTRELLATPPLFTVPPRESQLVRVGLRREPHPSRELSYRLRFTEVPPPPKPGFTGLRVALQLSVPVFVQPPVTASARAQWKARARNNGELELTVANHGNAHLKLTGAEVLVSGRRIGGAEQLHYVLPGESSSFGVPLERAVSAGTSVEIKAQTREGPRTFQTHVD